MDLNGAFKRVEPVVYQPVVYQVVRFCVVPLFLSGGVATVCNSGEWVGLSCCFKMKTSSGWADLHQPFNPIEKRQRMSTQSDNPYNALKTVFHEPNRLAIMAALSCAVDGLSFNELKQACGLTDGNLSRHLKALEEAQAIRIEKTFVGVKPRTTVFLSEGGRERFLDYVKALEEVLQKVTASLATTSNAMFLSPPHTHECTTNAN